MKKFKLFLKTWMLVLSFICIAISAIALFAAGGYYIGKLVGPFGMLGLFLILFSAALAAAVTL